MPDGAVLIYLYDGSFEGFLTAVFEAYARKEEPDGFLEPHLLQFGFEQREVLIETDEAKATRVERGLVEKIGHPAYRTVWTTFLSGSEEKGAVLYRYIQTCFRQGRRVYTNLAHPDVLAMNALLGPITREVQKYLGFVRFSRMENGVYYGRISPRSNVVPLLMPHFADRFSSQPFLLHDTVHELAGVCAGGEWYLTDTNGLTLPELADEEVNFRRMWKRFYDSVTIQERINPRCRRGLMPKRYWDNMIELTFQETPRTRRGSMEMLQTYSNDTK